MLKKLRLATLLLGTALILLSPAGALARDNDDWRHERHEWREHHHYRVHYRTRHVTGYYDHWGYWHQYGYYDRWGYYHRYGY